MSLAVTLITITSLISYHIGGYGAHGGSRHSDSLLPSPLAWLPAESNSLYRGSIYASLGRVLHLVVR